jgi:hypothetical protein
MSRFPHFLGNRLEDSGKTVSLNPRKIPDTHLLEAEQVSELGRYGKMNKIY